LHLPEVRQEIKKADLVLPSLDAAITDDFHKINRPANDLDIKSYIKGLEDFRQEFNGQIWLEVLIIPDFNDDIENLQHLKDAILRIKPDKIQLNTLDRPGTLNNIRPATIPELKHIIEFWALPNAEIIAPVPERKDIVAFRKDIEDAILETIARRPCTLDDLHKILSIHINELNKYLGVLEDENKIETVKLERGFFYKIH